MTCITTTRVCASLGALDHEWAIVAEFPSGPNEECLSGWKWHLPLDEVGPFLVARDDDGQVATTQRKTGPGQFVLYAKLAGARRVA